MNDEQLRERLARLDPQAGQSVAPLTPERKERAMTSTDPTPTESRAFPRRPLLAAAAVLVVAAAGGTAVVLAQGEDTAPGSTPAAPTTLALTAQPVDPFASCLRVSAQTLRDAQVAFAGNVLSVNGTSAVLDVTRWYRGGQAEMVSVTQQGGPNAGALAGVPFEVGTTYLVAASATSIPPCSGTGPDTPALRALFEQVFTQ